MRGRTHLALAATLAVFVGASSAQAQVAWKTLSPEEQNVALSRMQQGHKVGNSFASPAFRRISAAELRSLVEGKRFQTSLPFNGKFEFFPGGVFRSSFDPAPPTRPEKLVMIGLWKIEGDRICLAFQKKDNDPNQPCYILYRGSDFILLGHVTNENRYIHVSMTEESALSAEDIRTISEN
jgi:hypothetical protein